MQILGLLAPLLLVVALAGFVWLVVVAFRHSVAWGLLVLFLSPITAVIFAVKNWEDSRRPFLIYAGSSAASLAIMFATLAWFAGSSAVAMSEAVAEMAETESGAVVASTHAMDPTVLDAMAGPDRPATPAAPDDQQPAAGLEEAAGELPEAEPDPRALAALEPPRLSVDDDEVAPSALRHMLEGEDLSVAEAGRHVGETLRIVERGGLEHVGRLARVTDRSIVLEKSIAYGEFSFEVPQREVATIQLVVYP